MSFIPKPQEIYRHFKGNLYQIVTVAEHSETGQLLVIYQAMYGDFKTYARDLEMFTGRVDREKYPDVSQEFRFELQGPDSGRQRRESMPKPAPEIPEGGVLPKPAPEIPEGGVLPKPVPEIPEGGALPKPEEAGRGAAEPKSSEPNPSELLDPMVEQFLDAGTYEEKLNILACLHHRITQEMVTTMAVASDVEVEDGELEDRYLQLKNCLLTLEKYECKRLE